MGGWKNADFKLNDADVAEHIVAACVQQRPTHILGQPPPRDPRSSFVVALAPPKPERCLAFGRSVVFVIDRSGSMNGEPMEAANEALTTGLRSLTEHDYFNICAFDDGQEYFDANAMTQATPKNVERAMAWMNEHCVARYTTDIYTPLSEALKLLAGCAGNGAFYTLVPIRPRWRCGRRSLRTLPVASLRPPLPFNTRPRRLSTPTDAFQLHPDFRL